MSYFDSTPMTSKSKVRTGKPWINFSYLIRDLNMQAILFADRIVSL